MVKLFHTIEAGQSLPRLFSWLELLNTLAPVWLTATVSSDLRNEGAGCRSACRKVERFCLEKGIRVKILGDPGEPSQVVPDLVLLNGGRTAAVSSHPALMLPDGAALPAELILLYDGSAASKAAIRQFAELFPSLTYLPANLLYIRDNAGKSIPDEAAVRTLGARLYHRFRLINIQRRSTGFFEAWLGMMTNPWIVAAKVSAYGRPAAMQAGLAAELIRIRPMPAFAA